MEEIRIGCVILEFSRVSGDSGMRMPPELAMLSKTLLNLDEIGRTLDRRFDPNASVRRNAADLVRARLLRGVSPGSMFGAAMEAKEFVEELPSRVNRILDAVARSQIRLQIDAIDESTLVEGFQKVANRITAGLILAALIVGAGMLMPVETSFRLFGYPGFAILCFLGAAGGGFWLLVTILLSDRETKKKPPGVDKPSPL